MQTRLPEYEPDLDSTPPVLTITSPATGSETSVPEVWFRGTAEDRAATGEEAPSGVKSVQCLVGTAATAATNEGTSYSAWSCRVVLPAFVLPQGNTYNIRVQARDHVGNLQESTISVVARDRTPPALTVTQPTAHAVIGDVQLRVAGTAADDFGGSKLTSGIQVVECLLNGVKFEVHPAAKDNWSTWSCEIPLGSSVPKGGKQHTLTVRCLDKAGNTTERVIPFLARDETAPRCEVTRPEPGIEFQGTEAGAVVRFGGFVSDNQGDAKLQSGVRRVLCEVGGTSFEASPSSGFKPSADGYEWSVDVRIPAPGTHSVSVRAEDQEGRISTRTVQVAVALPYVSGDKDPFSLRAYLSDLLDYATRRLKTSAGGPAVDRKLLGDVFLQPFSRIMTGGDTVLRPVRQVRLVVEALRRYLPVAHWSFDESGGSMASNVVGEEAAGTLSGATWAPAKVGRGALQFDGVDDYVQVGATTTLEMTEALTISAWIFPTGTVAPVGIIASREGEYEVARFPDGSIQWAFANAQPGWAWINTGAVAPSNRWSHVCVSYDAGAVKTYLNGTLVHTHAGAGPIGDADAARDDFRIGGRQAASEPFQGRIDEVRIYRRALNAQEVAALTAPPARLVAHWKLDEGQGLTVSDAAGNGNQGTVQGASWKAGRLGGSLAFDGVNDSITLTPSTYLRDVVNNFTLSFWAKPTGAHQIDPESTSGTGGVTGQRYALAPDQGGIAYGAPSHAGAGVSVGTNGVSIYEHSDGYLPALLVHQASISGWTHLAVVYRDRQPRLYVNGKLARIGQTSPKQFVHACPLALGGSPYGYFAGELDEVRIYSRILSPEEIGALAAGREPEPEIPGLAVAEAEYREDAYRMLLAQIGTSYEELRLSRAADAGARQALARRLGISIGPSRPDLLDRLFLEPREVTEADLESIFGLVATTRDPLEPGREPELLSWRREHLRARWRQEDHPVDRTDLLPVIDPDLIGPADLRDPIPGNLAFNLWTVRSGWLTSELARLRALREAEPGPLAGLDAALRDVWGATAVDDLAALAKDRKEGKDVSARLKEMRLRPQAFLQLTRIRELAATPSMTVLPAEWAEVDSILVQARKVRDQYPEWHDAESELTLDPEFFVLDSGANDRPLPTWRATPAARREWQEKLRARIDQQESLAQALQAAVEATEEATLPRLRDALVYAVGPDPDLPDRLTRRLLLDVKTSGVPKTTRVDQAIETLQGIFFAQRAGRLSERDYLLGGNPAAGWVLTRDEATFDQEWKWMGTYATWRAAMFVFVYPENLLYPTLREPGDRTPAFDRFLDLLRDYSLVRPSDAQSLAGEYLEQLEADLGSLRASDLIAHWRFDEGTGATTADASGNGLAGAVQGATWTDGRIGKALAFDGSGASVQVSSSPVLEVGKNGADFSVAFSILVRQNGTGAWRAIVHKGATDAQRTFAMWLHPTTNRIHYRISTTASVSEGSDSKAALPLNTWVHVAYVKSGNRLRLYLNGALDSEVALSGVVGSNTGPLYIGKSPWHAGINGLLDELRIYDAALSPQAVAALAAEAYEPFAVTDRMAEGDFARQRDASRALLQPFDTATSPDQVPAFLKEVFYFVPLQLALQLQRSGQFLAALDWYQSVYAYNLPPEQREIYHGLRSERAIQTVYQRNPDEWLFNATNPHQGAVRRANAYTRFTLQSLARCFIEYADAEFTRETEESLPRARELYMNALGLLDVPEMQEVGRAGATEFPPNPMLQALRGQAELNLFKLRNGRNIAGMQRQLETARARGGGLSGLPTVGSGGQLVVPDQTELRPTPYYYSVLMERAKQLAGIAQQIEASYLSMLEKTDAENYGLLRAGHDLDLARAGVELQELRVNVARLEEGLARRQWDRSEEQRAGLDEWLSAGVTESERSLLTAYEEAARHRKLQSDIEMAVTVAQAFTTALAADPTTMAGAVGSAALVSVGAIARAGSAKSVIEAEAKAQSATFFASHERRVQEWLLQRQLAVSDLAVVEQQIRIAQDQIQVVEKEKTIASAQYEQARVIKDFLANKFTNAELYEWMSGVLGRVYSYFLQQATAVARLAQSQLAFERQEAPPAFIQSDYWQAPQEGSATDGEKAPDRRGLTGSARLLRDVYQLDQYAFETNRRKLQIAQAFSLAQLAPVEFQRFRETGRMTFSTPMELFDRAFPGHYLRLIRRVRVSVVALVPPVQGIRATLATTGVSRVVTGRDVFQTVVVRRDPELIAFTSPSNATGLFELDPQSEMLLPFEAMGVDTTWELILPKAANPFDYRTLADVILAVEYTALNSFTHREQVIRSLDGRVSADRTFSLRDQFPDQWYELHNGTDSEPLEITFKLRREDFPPNLEEVRIKHVLLYLPSTNGGTGTVRVADLRAPQTSVGPTAAAESSDGIISTRRGNGASWGAMIGTSPVGDWKLTISDPDTRQRFRKGEIDDALLLLTYGAQTPSWT